MESVTPLSTTQDVKVKLLLAGGHEYILWLKPDAPLLENLLKALVARSQNQASSTLFQIPIDEGHSALCFPSDHLIGVVTEPPLWVQQKSSVPPSPQPLQPAPSNPNVLESKYIQLRNFLKPAELTRLLKFVGDKEPEFVPTTTSTGAADYRKSLVLHSFPEFSNLVINRLHSMMSDLFSKLEMTPFEVSQIEAQLTAHNDGNFYKLHNDSGSADTATRTITYVYYFYREPKSFSGGELVIYDSKIQNNYYVKADSYKVIEPYNNSIVFFLSRYMHEVLPVSCPSKLFTDSRFTINGWIRK
jgi:SM-20-related protein